MDRPSIRENILLLNQTTCLRFRHGMFVQGNAFLGEQNHHSEWSEVSNLLFCSLNRRHPNYSRAGDDLHIGHVIGIGFAVIIDAASLDGYCAWISIRCPIEQAATVSAEVRCNSIAATSLACVRLEASAQNFELVQRHQQIVKEAISGQAPLVNAVAAKLGESARLSESDTLMLD